MHTWEKICAKFCVWEWRPVGSCPLGMYQVGWGSRWFKTYSRYYLLLRYCWLAADNMSFCGHVEGLKPLCWDVHVGSSLSVNGVWLVDPWKMTACIPTSLPCAAHRLWFSWINTRFITLIYNVSLSMARVLLYLTATASLSGSLSSEVWKGNLHRNVTNTHIWGGRSHIRCSSSTCAEPSLVNCPEG